MNTLILALSLHAIVVIAAFPLNTSRYLIVLLASCAFTLMANNAEASSATFCDGWSSTAQKMLDVRQQGLGKQDVKDLLTEADVWSIPMDYALKYAFQVPVDTDLIEFKAYLFKACREDDL